MFDPRQALVQVRVKHASALPSPFQKTAVSPEKVYAMAYKGALRRLRGTNLASPRIHVPPNMSISELRQLYPKVPNPLTGPFERGILGESYWGYNIAEPHVRRAKVVQDALDALDQWKTWDRDPFALKGRSRAVSPDTRSLTRMMRNDLKRHQAAAAEPLRHAANRDAVARATADAAAEWSPSGGISVLFDPIDATLPALKAREYNPGPSRLHEWRKDAPKYEVPGPRLWREETPWGRAYMDEGPYDRRLPRDKEERAKHIQERLQQPRPWSRRK